MKFSSRISLWAGLAGLATGLAIGTSWGDPALRRDLPSAADIVPRPTLDPLRGITRAEMLLAAREARARLDDGRPWAAWNTLRPFVDEDAADAPPSVLLLAAEAAAGWDGWTHVRRLLEGRDWLADEDGGRGLYLLARADERRGDLQAAAAAYRRYVPAATGEARGTAEARLGRVLLKLEQPTPAAAAFGRAADLLPAAADWLRVAQAEALAASDPSVTAAVSIPRASAASRLRAARTEARGRAAAGDTAGAVDRLAREAAALASRDATAAATLRLEQGRLLRAARRGGEARTLLRAVVADTTVSPSARVEAARRLGEVADAPAADEERARADAFEAGKKPGLAAKSLRAALRLAGAETPDEVLRVGRLLYDAGDWEPARLWLRKAAEGHPDAEKAAEGALLAARALVRSGDAETGMGELRRMTETRAGTAAAASAWFVLGDASDDRATGIAHYRRAAAVPASPMAREALFRVGDRALKEGDADAAVKAWEEYAARYPRGEQTAEAAYRAGRMHEKAGRAERARAMYRAAIDADPVSYHAVRAADRLGADPIERAVREPRAWDGLAGDAAEAAEALRRLSALEAVGFDDAWAEELEAQSRRFARRDLALLTLAEGLRDGGHTIEAIRIGRRLLERRGGAWDVRLLHVVFPFPYRGMLLDEAERADVDPFLLAGLVRQESSFNHEARSWVGATGLSQIMPSTGAWLAPGVGIRAFSPELLAVPEINLRMGASYLRDQLRRYRGARDLALAAYNAGPGRADRWKRELGYGGDADAFREKIPFAETREYVKVVLRNAEIYRRLYGHRSPGLAEPDD